MRSISAYLCSISLILSPLNSFAEGKAFDPVLNQFLIDKVLDQTFAEMKNVKTGRGAADTLARFYPQKDLPAMQEKLKRLKSVPQLERLNRGFAYVYAGKRFEFVIEDAVKLRFTVNRKVNWNYRHDTPVTLQLDVLRQALEKETAYHFSPFDEANADGGTSIIIGILIAGVVVPILTTITNSYLIPKYTAWYCANQDPNDFVSFKFCEEYFKHQANTRPKVPPAKQVEAERPSEVLQVEKKCSKKDDPDFWVQMEGETGVILRRTIKYGPDKKPEMMIEEQIKPHTDRKLTYKLTLDGALLKVSDGADFVLSRDKNDAEMMNSEKFEAMKAYDKALESTIGFIKTCDDTIAENLTMKASQPGYAPSVASNAGKGTTKEMAIIPAGGGASK